MKEGRFVSIMYDRVHICVFCSIQKTPNTLGGHMKTVIFGSYVTTHDATATSCL